MAAYSNFLFEESNIARNLPTILYQIKCGDISSPQSFSDANKFSISLLQSKEITSISAGAIILGQLYSSSPSQSHYNFILTSLETLFNIISHIADISNSQIIVYEERVKCINQLCNSITIILIAYKTSTATESASQNPRISSQSSSVIRKGYTLLFNMSQSLVKAGDIDIFISVISTLSVLIQMFGNILPLQSIQSLRQFTMNLIDLSVLSQQFLYLDSKQQTNDNKSSKQSSTEQNQMFLYYNRCFSSLPLKYINSLTQLLSSQSFMHHQPSILPIIIYWTKQCLYELINEQQDDGISVYNPITNIPKDQSQSSSQLWDQSNKFNNVISIQPNNLFLKQRHLSSLIQFGVQTIIQILESGSFATYLSAPRSQETIHLYHQLTNKQSLTDTSSQQQESIIEDKSKIGVIGSASIFSSILLSPHIVVDSVLQLGIELISLNFCNLQLQYKDGIMKERAIKEKQTFSLYYEDPEQRKAFISCVKSGLKLISTSFTSFRQGCISTQYGRELLKVDKNNMNHNVQNNNIDLINQNNNNILINIIHLCSIDIQRIEEEQRRRQQQEKNVQDDSIINFKQDIKGRNKDNKENRSKSAQNKIIQSKTSSQISQLSSIFHNASSSSSSLSHLTELKLQVFQTISTIVSIIGCASYPIQQQSVVLMINEVQPSLIVFRSQLNIIEQQGIRNKDGYYDSERGISQQRNKHKKNKKKKEDDLMDKDSEGGNDNNNKSNNKSNINSNSKEDIHLFQSHTWLSSLIPYQSSILEQLSYLISHSTNSLSFQFIYYIVQQCYQLLSYAIGLRAIKIEMIEYQEEIKEKENQQKKEKQIEQSEIIQQQLQSGRNWQQQTQKQKQNKKELEEIISVPSLSTFNVESPFVINNQQSSSSQSQLMQQHSSSQQKQQQLTQAGLASQQCLPIAFSLLKVINSCFSSLSSIYLSQFPLQFLNSLSISLNRVQSLLGLQFQIPQPLNILPLLSLFQPYNQQQSQMQQYNQQQISYQYQYQVGINSTNQSNLLNPQSIQQHISLIITSLYSFIEQSKLLSSHRLNAPLIQMRREWNNNQTNKEQQLSAKNKNNKNEQTRGIGIFKRREIVVNEQEDDNEWGQDSIVDEEITIITEIEDIEKESQQQRNVEQEIQQNINNIKINQKEMVKDEVIIEKEDRKEIIEIHSDHQQDKANDQEKQKEKENIIEIISDDEKEETKMIKDFDVEQQEQKIIEIESDDDKKIDDNNNNNDNNDNEEEEDDFGLVDVRPGQFKE